MRIKSSSHFVFVAISSRQNEDPQDKDRFIKDVFHSIYVLQSIGVPGSSISIVSDWTVSDWVAIGFNPFQPIAPKNACAYIQALDCENLFIVSSCHGDLIGIGGIDSIRPNDLIQSIKSNAKVQNCLVFFGQCYADVFNYTNVFDEQKNIVYIGATGMRTGISSTMSWNISPTQSFTWIANISVYYMFEWLQNPIDVDNDGEYSIMDLYKYVSYKTNNKTEEIEKVETMSFLDTKIRVEIQKLLQQGQNTLLSQLDAAANQALLRYIIPHQDCWILNARPASSMFFEF